METNSKARGLMTSEEYLEDLISRVNSGTDEVRRSLSREIMGLILISGQRGDVTQLDCLMEKVNVSTANPLLVATILRASLRFIPHLKHWVSLRDRVLIVLKNSSEIDVKGLMLNIDIIDQTHQPPTELDGLLRVHPNFRK